MILARGLNKAQRAQQEDNLPFQFRLVRLRLGIPQELIMALAWSEELSVGNAMIDSEHQNLIIMVNNIDRAIRAKDSSALPQAFEQLEECLCTHFANEEKMAQAITFPFTNNVLEHKYVLKSLHIIRDAISAMAAKNGVWAEDAAEHYSAFLGDWLTNHVLNEDMLMKPILQTYPYDFTPP